MRADGWESLLAAYVTAAPPFAWGETDCALWAAEWVRLCTGQDFASDWKGRYKTAAGAAKLMKARGFSGPEDIADQHLTEKPVRLANRGDLLLHPQGALGICVGRHGVFLTAAGFTAHPTLGCDRAWAV